MTPTLPGSLPGLLRVGSPVVAVVHHRARPAVVVEVIRDGFRIALQGPSYPGERNGCVQLTGRGLSLDLTDPTGRIHAWWWLQTKQPADSVRLGCDPRRLSLALSSIRRGEELTASEEWEFALYCEAHAGASDV